MTILFAFTWLIDEINDILSLFYPFVEINWMMAEARVRFRPVIIIKITFFDRLEIPNFSEILKSPMINNSKLSSQFSFASCQVRTWSYKFLIPTWGPLIVYQQDWVTLYRSMWGHQKLKNSLPKKPNHFQVKMVREF